MADYITLANSNQSLSKRFRSVSFRRMQRKVQDIRRTLGGARDASFGSVYNVHRLTLFVPEVSTDVNYGTRTDLETLHLLNDPGGTPSAFLRYIDYWGVLNTNALIVNNLEFEPVGTLLAVSGAWYLVQVEIDLG